MTGAPIQRRERQQVQSVILPRWCRRSPKVAEVLPLLYLHGLRSSDFMPALTELFGAAGLSASVITRLCTQWQAEREAFAQRDLSEVDHVYCFADGVHFSIRLGEQGSMTSSTPPSVASAASVPPGTCPTRSCATAALPCDPHQAIPRSSLFCRGRLKSIVIG
jgi:Transposase, Mutator family